MDAQHEIAQPSQNATPPTQDKDLRTKSGGVRALRRGWSLNIPIVMLIIAGAVTSLLAFEVTRRANDQTIQRQLETIADAQTRQIQLMRLQGLDALGALGAFMASQSDVSEDAFDRFVALLNPNQNIYGTLLWAPRVGGSERERFIRSMQQVDPDFNLLERTPRGLAFSNSLRVEYLPVLYEEKQEWRENHEVRGFDIYSSSIYGAAAERARDEGHPIVPPAPFTVDLSGGALAQSFYIFWPVYYDADSGASVPNSVAGRRAAFRGLAIGRYRFDEYYSALVRGGARLAYDIDSLSDLRVDGGDIVNNLHYDSADDQFTFLPSEFPPVRAGTITIRRDLVNAGRINTFLFHFPAQYVAPLRSRDPYWIAGLCLVLTALLALYMRREQTRRSAVEAIVADRTVELTSANAALAHEAEERRRAEAAAERSSAFFRTVLDASPFAIVARSPEGRVTLWNRAAERIFGYTNDEILGSDTTLTPADTSDTLHRNIERTSAGEEFHGQRTQRLRKDGSVVPLRVSAAPIYEQGEVIGGCAILEDMTERLRVEEQLAQAQKMEAIGNLTGGMAHDFNNLLGGVIGNLDLLKMQVKPGDVKAELVGDALTAALSATELTRRLLAFARRQPLAPKRVALNDLIRNVERLLSRVLGEGIRISLDLADDLWVVVVDPAQLESSIVNLANNARDAMPDGGTLTIATANRQLDADYAAQQVEVSPGDYAMISVNDTGTGMPPEVIERIFEPFYTTKETGKGTGLGLSMVFGFIKQSAGHIAVYSEPGLGTTFRLYLPRASEGEAQADTSAPAEAIHGAGETILVVEDNTIMRRVVVRQLTELGYDVIETQDAASALVILADKKVDLVFTDIVMPGQMNGMALAERVMTEWPAVKVILASGFPGSTLSNFTKLTSRPVRLLNKPYRREDLAQAVHEALHG